MSSAANSPHCVWDALILGAGAAGLFCAAQAAARGRRVLLVDHNAQPGRKILISGGGRCNFTHLHASAANYLSENPHFAKSALAGFTPRDFLELVERHRIRWNEKTEGQLFCDGSARQILDLLLAECAAGRPPVELLFDTRIDSVAKTEEGFQVETARGAFAAKALVVATGGLSIPRLGATGLGYDLARQFGLRVVEPRPALVPLLLGGREAAWTELAGVAADVTAWVEPESARRNAIRPRFREKMLVTHRGLSGPAILQISSYWQAGAQLWLELLPEAAAPLAPLLEAQARRDPQTYRQTLRGLLPRRLADFLAEHAGPAGWSNADLEEAECRLRAFPLHPTGTEGFEKAEVTAGGVSTADLDARTLQARAHPGLFFIGEVVDVTGQLGGFNFQWAWSSAAAAARALSVC